MRQPRQGDRRTDVPETSRHSRLADELRLPADEADPERAQALCAAICRDLLADLSPALLLLPASERRRAQALAAYTRTLFDFALQGGLDGERLAQINRWQFELERALAGDPPGQPVFVAMALSERDRPWSRAALDTLAGTARHTAIAGTNDRTNLALASALSRSLLGETADDEIVVFAAQLLAVLSARKKALDRLQAESASTATGPNPTLGQQLDRVAAAKLPHAWRRFLRFLAAAADSTAGIHDAPVASLGLFRRLRFLLRALGTR